MDYRIGCSGWSYRHWVGNLYPAGLPQSRWLERYCSLFDTVELNNTFYRLPSESVVRNWRERTPAGFKFSVKASRLITHFRRFADCEAELATFLGRVRRLGDSLGPILYQAPPSMRRNDSVLERFLAMLPPDLVHAFEFRHESWWVEPVWEILRGRGAAFCVFNMGDVTTPVVATCGELYARFHGPASSYASGYSDGELEAWRDRIGALPGVSRAWLYFNNDIGGHAHEDALRLKAILGV